MNLKVQEYMQLPYTTVLKRDEDGDVVARISELKGCVAHGENETEAIDNIKSMMALWIESALEDGREIPLPLNDEDSAASGKLLVRTSRSVHVACLRAAAEDGVSLNQWIVTVLSREVGFREGRSAVVKDIAVPAAKALKLMIKQVEVAKSWHLQAPARGADKGFIENLARNSPTHWKDLGPLRSSYEEKDKHGIVH